MSVDRAAVFKRVTAECKAVHDPCTWANLAALMTDEERAAFKGGVEIVEASTSDGRAGFEPPEPAVSEAPRPENPYTAMRTGEQALTDAWQELRERRNAVQASRVAFGKALEDWNRGAPVATHEQAAREFIATSNAARAARAAANPDGVWHPGITRTAAATAGGSRRAGGGAAFRRGAYTKTEAMKINAERLHQAAQAAKMPPRG